MSEFFGSIFWLLVALGVLVTFHEFGHYWVARRCGVKVLRFSIGFGRPLWLRRGRDGTEWVIAALPLGGFVKMLGERDGLDENGEPVPAAQQQQAFNHKPVLQRMAIVAGGPVANLILCLVFFWAMFVVGRPDYSATVGHVQGIAAEAGLARGDTVLAIGERETPTWTETQLALLSYALDRGQVPVRVRSVDGGEAVRILDMREIPKGLSLADVSGRVGLSPGHLALPPVIGSVLETGPAAGKLRKGDRILAIDDRRIGDWADMSPLIRQAGERIQRSGGTAVLTIERDGRQQRIELVPSLLPDRTDAAADAPRSWRMGISPSPANVPPPDAVLRYGPLEAFPAAFSEIGFQTGQIFAMFGRVFTGRIQVTETVSGPIGIAQAANRFANNGASWFFFLLGMLSLSLAILNLLPIPLLDGGHLLYYFIELVKGSPLNERAVAAGQYVGLALLAGLIGLSFYNDLYRLLQ